MITETFELLTRISYMQYIILCIIALGLIKHILYLAIAPLYKVKETRRKITNVKPGYEPRVSVIVPAWNEEVGIIRTIESIFNNTYKNIEIVVVNDGSTDSTHARILDFKTNVRLPNKKLKYIHQNRSGKGSALNNGIINSTGEIILTVDADSVLKSDAIENLVRYYQDSSIDGVLGNITVANTEGLVGLAQKIEYLIVFYYKKVHAVFGTEYVFGGACASYRRRVFDRIGYYDIVSRTEDIDLTLKFVSHGLKSTYASDVICYTEGAQDIRGLLNQRVRWSKGKLEAFLKYKSLFFSLDRQHNKFLSFIILPFSVLSIITTFFEPIFLGIVFTYVLISGDVLMLSFLMLILLLLTNFAAFDSNDRKDIWLLILFPLTWTLWVLISIIEFRALVESLYSLIRGKEISWQKWDRKGIQISTSS